MDDVIPLYDRFRDLTQRLQLIEQERNQISGKKLISEMAISRAKQLKSQSTTLSSQLTQVESELYDKAARIPNSTHPDSPLGSPESNQVVRTFGPATRQRKIIDHLELGKRKNLIDFASGATVAGSQHYFLKGKAAMLELALIQYAVKTCLKHGFEFMITPDIAYTSFVKACGFNPRSADAALPIYTVHQEENDETQSLESKKALIGTSEIPLAGYFVGKQLDPTEFPKKFVGLSHCFRPEVGHHGSESRGLYRVHQFTKVEMFTLCRPDQSQHHFDEIVSIQEQILNGLGLSCRVLNMASEELGASAHCKYDIEAWFPGRDGWGELSSASNCTDYQSRRLGLRYRETAGSKNWIFPHTLNGTACAVPRVIQAILENFQDEVSGDVVIPEPLHEFMLDGSKVIN